MEEKEQRRKRDISQSSSSDIKHILEDDKNDNEDCEKQKRRERLKAWQESKKNSTSQGNESQIQKENNINVSTYTHTKPPFSNILPIEQALSVTNDDTVILETSAHQITKVVTHHVLGSTSKKRLNRLKVSKWEDATPALDSQTSSNERLQSVHSKTFSEPVVPGSYNKVVDTKPLISSSSSSGSTAVAVSDTTATGAEEEDPLEAFMSSLYDTGDIAEQKDLPLPNLKGQGGTAATEEQRHTTNKSIKVITMEEILAGNMKDYSNEQSIKSRKENNKMEIDTTSFSVNETKSPLYPAAIFTNMDKLNRGWESDANSPVSFHGNDNAADEDMTWSSAAIGDSDLMEEQSEVIESEEQREAREEREKKEFMDALRKAREEEDFIREKLLKINQAEESKVTATNASIATKISEAALGRVFAGEGDIVEEHEVEQKKRSALEILEEAKKGKMLKEIDHSKIEYPKFRKNLYIVPRTLSKLNESEIVERREDLQLKVRGKGCPAPVDTWAQCGLSDRILQTINNLQFKEPFAIQRQAIPAIMCGRDVIGVAKTGSGKTLAFLLPMLRHILDQPPLVDGEGPIGLIMAPSRELAFQIYTEAKKFTKPLGLRVAAIYGGAGVAEQIADLKRGSEIVVCTPGRMIDILCMQAGKLVSLKRVTMVVMDEADRMFDMGFEPQIKMIVQNVRPDRQVVLFSATFPKQIEKLAKSVLKIPLEIIVGERSTVNKDITQIIEVHEEDEKFLRLLQLLGVWYEKGSVLVFVEKQEKCDQLFQELLKLGYPCLSLHGGKDQIDRDHTLHEFKTGIKTVMIATSVAGRGLDVPDIVCVVNYHCPNHVEDYVHRVGRTGRAGRKGTAYTFISQREDQYSPSMVKLLQKAGQPVPKELQDMAAQFRAKVAKGEAHWGSSGFEGKGFTFDASEMNESQKIASMQRKAYEKEQGLITDVGDDADDEDDEEVTTKITAAPQDNVTTNNITMPINSTINLENLNPLEKAKLLAASLNLNKVGGAITPLVVPVTKASGPIDPLAALARAKAIALQMTTGGGISSATDQVDNGEYYYGEELDINDYPPQARKKVTNKNSIDEITDRTGVAIISRGAYIPPGKKLENGERRLHLLIEGSSEMSVRQAKLEIQRVLEEETIRLSNSGSILATGRYSVL